MIVCNHPGILENYALTYSPLFPSYTPKKELAKNYLLGPLLKGLQSVFVPRTRGNDDVVNIIMKRQAQIADEGKSYSPLVLFSEGTTSNGAALSKFKRGAFMSMRPLTPCYIKFGDCLVNPAYDIIRFEALAILLLSNFSMYTTTLYIMPTFCPNDQMIQRCS